jgi:hypothetical protein
MLSFLDDREYCLNDHKNGSNFIIWADFKIKLCKG